MKVIDISTEINTDYWEPEKIERKVVCHKEGADKLGKSNLYFSSSKKGRKIKMPFFSKSKKISHKDFPDGQGLSQMWYSLSTHTGTHIDAPWHYGKSKKGASQRTISDLPLKYFYGNGVLLDFSEDDTCEVNAENVRIKLSQISYAICENDIVLICTGAGNKVGTQKYFTDYRAIKKSAVEYLTSLGVKVIGTDAFSFDPPFPEMIDVYLKTKNKDVLWPAHFYGREKPYVQIERLNNLNEIPVKHGFKVSCFPIKLKNADAAWCRAVALVD